jgi:hypothetical protein
VNELTLSTATPGMTVTATLMQGTTVTASGIAMAETSVPGDYVGSVPSNTAAGRYRVLALSDGVIVGSGELVWSGSAELPDPPAAPSDVGLCRVFGYLEGIDNDRVLPTARIEFRLIAPDSTRAVASERLIGDRAITVKVDDQGRIVGPSGTLYIDLQRTDMLTPAGTFYEVTSAALGLMRKKITLTTDTADLRTLLLA